MLCRNPRACRHPYIIFIIKQIDKQSTDLYRDDGLVLLRNISKQKSDRIRKDIIEIFKKAGFKIEMKANLHIVDFLVVTFNLLDGTFKPYKKQNDQLLYVKTSSNHPPQIIKHLPISISNRLSNNSSNKQVFDMSKCEYEKALRESGYKNVSLIYTDKKGKKQKRNRSRNINRVNPAFNKNVSTYVAKRFPNLLDQHFPKSNKLQAIFNRNTVKVSYSCTQNMSSMIKSHNKKVINKDVKESKSCNCRVKSECPLNGQCQVTDIIYKCTVLSPDKPNKVYLGTAEGDFKKRFYNHRKSFNNEGSANDTTLSKYIWELKETSNSSPALIWSIAKTVPSYSNISKKCLLCRHEKLELINYPRPEELLNNKSELISRCRHANKFSL